MTDWLQQGAVIQMASVTVRVWPVSDSGSIPATPLQLRNLAVAEGVLDGVTIFNNFE